MAGCIGTVMGVTGLKGVWAGATCGLGGLTSLSGQMASLAAIEGHR